MATGQGYFGPKSPTLLPDLIPVSVEWSELVLKFSRTLYFYRVIVEEGAARVDYRVIEMAGSLSNNCLLETLMEVCEKLEKQWEHSPFNSRFHNISCSPTLCFSLTWYKHGKFILFIKCTTLIGQRGRISAILYY